ncbi:hypothetical protein [Variovorax gossypii]
MTDADLQHLQDTTAPICDEERQQAAAEIIRLRALINNPHTEEFLSAVQYEAAHQRYRFGEAENREKSAENWFWLVGKLTGKCLRAVIAGDKEKALHHTISSAAALANWFQAIKLDTTGAGIGRDHDLPSLETGETDAVDVRGTASVVVQGVRHGH